MSKKHCYANYGGQWPLGQVVCVDIIALSAGQLLQGLEVLKIVA